MGQKLELAGNRYGRLLVIDVNGKQGSHRTWRCRCDCGAEHTATGNNLRRGLVLSCGCFSVEVATARLVTHGMTLTPTYKSWRNMLSRCSNPSASSYARYGGAGVTVCDRWRASFEDFFADMGERPDGTTIDRWPDGAGNYEPGNCRWATHREQRMNQARGTISLEQAAEVRRLRASEGLSAARIASRLGISVGAASGVIHLGNLAVKGEA